LLGNPKGEQRDFRRGRLSFFPTFFDQLEVGVINPHSRERGAGTQPIHIEQAPRTSQGVFALLYTPTIPSGLQEPLPGWDEVLGDLDLVGQATYALLVELGFGAKTASGMGRAEEAIPEPGAYLLVHRWVESPLPLPPPPEGTPPPQTFQPDTPEFKDESGNWPYYASDEELEAHIPGSAARSRYKKQRMAYREWRCQRDQWEAWEQQVAALKGRRERRMLRLGQDELKTLRDLQNLRPLLTAKTEADREGKGNG